MEYFVDTTTTTAPLPPPPPPPPRLVVTEWSSDKYINRVWLESIWHILWNFLLQITTTNGLEYILIFWVVLESLCHMLRHFQGVRACPWKLSNISKYEYSNHIHDAFLIGEIVANKLYKIWIFCFFCFITYMKHFLIWVFVAAASN